MTIQPIIPALGRVRILPGLAKALLGLVLALGGRGALALPSDPETVIGQHKDPPWRLIRVADLVPGANLSGVIFRPYADLTEADFRRVNLDGADFSTADCSGALFLGVDLASANLSGATLTGADFSQARIPASWVGLAPFLDAKTDDAIRLPASGGAETDLPDAAPEVPGPGGKAAGAGSQPPSSAGAGSQPPSVAAASSQPLPSAGAGSRPLSAAAARPMAGGAGLLALAMVTEAARSAPMPVAAAESARAGETLGGAEPAPAKPTSFDSPAAVMLRQAGISLGQVARTMRERVPGCLSTRSSVGKWLATGTMRKDSFKNLVVALEYLLGTPASEPQGAEAGTGQGRKPTVREVLGAVPGLRHTYSGPRQKPAVASHSPSAGAGTGPLDSGAGTGPLGSGAGSGRVGSGAGSSSKRPVPEGAEQSPPKRNRTEAWPAQVAGPAFGAPFQAPGAGAGSLMGPVFPMTMVFPGQLLPGAVPALVPFGTHPFGLAPAGWPGFGPFAQVPALAAVPQPVPMSLEDVQRIKQAMAGRVAR